MSACTLPTPATETTPAQSTACSTTCFTPRVDVWETEHEFLFQAEMPGVQSGDISLNYENGHLTLHGKVKQDAINGRGLLREYGVGDYHRQFSVNDEVDAGKISADFKHGVLTVKLPKREELKPRKIAITV